MSEKTYRSFIHGLNETVHKEAGNYGIPIGLPYKVEVSAIPHTREADAWLGGVGSFGKQTSIGLADYIAPPVESVTYNLEFKSQSFTDDARHSMLTKAIRLKVQKKEQVSPPGNVEGTVVALKDWVDLCVDTSIDMSDLTAIPHLIDFLSDVEIMSYVTDFFSSLDESFKVVE